MIGVLQVDVANDALSLAATPLDSHRVSDVFEQGVAVGRSARRLGL